MALSRRGTGVGRYAMQDAAARARAAGCALLQLTSDMVRDAAHGFYEGLGYSPSHLGFKKHLNRD
ncbi:GNAT family N-acetyltransferase [uncultured Limimaricola sp.]|uniref:GNAT family N-acetyltransferase n=1 Tax=uncultured Limimaricola sp. TaxID=2211667 RepID=UPI0030F81277